MIETLVEGLLNRGVGRGIVVVGYLAEQFSYLEQKYEDETVGGMPTVAEDIDLVGIEKACGYPDAVCVDDFSSLDRELEKA